MKRVIFTIWDEIKKEISGPTEMEAKNIYNMDMANSLMLNEYFDKLVKNKNDYADLIGAKFICFVDEMKNFDIEADTEFTKVNLFKHHMMAKLAEEYDEVMYVDMDVVFNTDLNVFNELDLSKGIYVKDQDKDILCKEKSEIILSQIGKRAPTLKYFITKDLLNGKDNHVMNTGIMIGNSDHIRKIKFIERYEEAKNKINVLKTEPELINKYYYPNNESIFSYILEKYNVPYVLLDESWHKIYDDTPEEGLTGNCIHFINKQFGRFFKDKTKCIFSLHVDIPEERLDNPRSFKDNDLTKSQITKIQLNKYKDQLLDNHRDYASNVGAEYLFFGRDDQYEEFRKRFPDLSEYDVINLYKIWLLDKLVKEYDLVMYVDLDVYFRNNANVFDTVPANYALCCIYDTKLSLMISNTADYFKYFVKDFRNPQAKYWNTHALLTNDGLDGENNVFNTGVIVTSRYAMEKLDYFSDIDDVIETMKELKEEEFSMYPENIQKSFGYDNETIFSYKVNKNNVIAYRLADWWHTRHYYENKEAMKHGTPERDTSVLLYKAECKKRNTTIVHFISKNFGLVFDK